MTAHDPGWWATFAAAWQADWRERRRDWRVWAVVALGLALAFAAALMSATDLRDTARARADATQAEQQRWLSQGRKNPHAAAHYGVYAFKPQSPLAAVDPGIERYVGSSVWLEAHKQNEFVHRPVSDAPGTLRQFALTPALVLQVLVPLALVFLGFGALAGEREAGALRQLRLQTRRLAALGLARAAVLLVLGLVLALPACAAVLWVWTQMPVTAPAFDDAAARWAGFAAGYAAYLALWCLLIVAVSAACSTLLRSLAVLMALWATTTLVMPRAALAWAQQAALLPGGVVFRQQLEAALGEPQEGTADTRQQQALMAQYGVSRLEDLPVNWAGIALQRGEDHGNAIFDAHYGRLFAALRAQDAAVARWAWLSPTLAVAGLSAAAAGSDTEHHLQFVKGAEDHRRLIQRVLNDAITATPDRNGQRAEADRPLWSRVPPLQFRFAPLGTSLWHHALPLLALLAAVSLAFFLSLHRLQRGALT